MILKADTVNEIPTTYICVFIKSNKYTHFPFRFGFNLKHLNQLKRFNKHQKTTEFWILNDNRAIIILFLLIKADILTSLT